VNWIPLENLNDLEKIVHLSDTSYVVLFKHSTRCSISDIAKARLERATSLPVNTVFYYLDLLKHRDISASIAEQFNVQHESPQVIIVKNGECIYDESHNGISMDEIIVQTS
jgi:bacillithiol system protein YtxJ